MSMKKNGFTLIEILVATVIIAVISAIGIVSYSSINKRSRDAKRKSDLEQVRSALEMYRTDTGKYPPSPLLAFGYLEDKVSTQLVNTYLPSLPSDPKNMRYYYARDTVTDYSYCLCAALENLTDGKNECSRDPPYEISSNPKVTAYCLRNP